MTGFADPCLLINISQGDSLLCLGSTWQKKWSRVLEMIQARSARFDQDTDKVGLEVVGYGVFIFERVKTARLVGTLVSCVRFEVL